jgi:protein involved in polysaccharide export with SLBB domain
VEEFSRGLRLRRPPALAASDAAETPLLLGVVRPLIILPTKLLNDCRPQEIRLAIAHELAHLKRRDLLWNWLPTLTQVPLFFHPLVWLARRSWYLIQEMACDEMTLRTSPASPADYGRLLLKVLTKHRRISGVHFLAAGMGQSCSHLERRLDAMKRFDPRKRRAAIAGVLLVLVAGIVGVVPWRVTAQEPGGLVDTALSKILPTRTTTATASLLVLQTGETSPDAPERDALMTTYEALARSKKTLSDAVGRIPAEHRVDLADVPEDKWVDTIRKNLSVRTVPNTNILQLRYRSDDPQAAVAVLNAVIEVYLEFIQETDGSTARGTLEELTREKVSVEKMLQKKAEELRRANASLVEQLTETRNRRLEQARAGGTVGGSRQSSSEPRTSLAQIDDVVVRNKLLSHVAPDSHDGTERWGQVQRLLEDRAMLNYFRKHLGPAHPKIVSLEEKIRTAEQEMAEYQTQIEQRLDQSAKEELTRAIVSAIGIQEAEQELAGLRTMYDSILNRVKDIQLQEQSQGIRVAVVQAPQTLGRQSDRQQQAHPPAKEMPSDAIQAGDVLELSITTKHSASGVTVPACVAHDGTADIPLIGSVTLEEMTLEQAKNAVLDACAERRVLPDAEVELVFKSRRGRTGTVTIVGAVQNPGVYEMSNHSELRLLHALTMAGGLSSAAVDKVVIQRKTLGTDRPVRIEVSVEEAKHDAHSNVALAPGDVVRVERASDSGNDK